MKIKRINTAILLLALASMILTGCSNEDLANVTPQEETGNVSFSIVEKDYEPADNTPKSRAAEETKSEVQDLGDGLMAEVSLVSDTTHRADVPKTRAINTPTHYTIQAFQGGVKKGELKGKFNGSTFTPDTGQPKSISLPHGTYDFVCFNDGVTANGTQLTVNRSAAGSARFDVRRNVQINQDPKQQVTFTMKHAGAAVEFYAWYVNFWRTTKVTNVQYVNDWGQSVYKCEFINPGEQFKGTMATPVNAIPETMVYDFATNASTYPTMGQFSLPFEAWGGEEPLAYGATPGSLSLSDGSPIGSELTYFLPSTDCAKLKLTFTYGDICGSSLVGKSITIPDHKLLEANKRYFLLIRLYVTDQYLYDDGTAGPLAKNPGKPVIGVVIDPTRRVAIALHDAQEGGSDQIKWNNVTSQESSQPVTNYQELFTQNGMGKTYSTGAAMQAAHNYTPQPGSHQWDIPVFFEYLYMIRGLGRMPEDGVTYKNQDSYTYFIPSGAAATGFIPAPSSVVSPNLDITRFNLAFTKVLGTPLSGTYWTDAECKDGTEYKQVAITFTGNKFHLDIKSKNSTAKVRPIIHY